jgi:hypothetical protein
MKEGSISVRCSFVCRVSGVEKKEIELSSIERYKRKQIY